jgi:two-component system, NarL family, sensor histidine kinase UhpB
MKRPATSQGIEAYCRAVVAASLDAVLLTASEGRILAANPAACRMFRCTEEEFIRAGRSGFVDPSDPGLPAALEERAREGASRHELTFIRRDGERFPAEASSTIFRDENGKVLNILVIHDLTESKRREQELAASHARLHELAGRLQRVREEESTRIAREVHDELGQQLTGLKMDLRWIETSLERLAEPRLGGLLDKVVSATALLDDTVKTTQRIAAELRPALLDQLGLFAALRHESDQFRRRAGVECRFLASEASPRLTRELATACYRIVQEALTNVARHAAATHVEIEFLAAPDAFVIEVRDNGRGIAPEAWTNAHSLGLLGMQERARSLAGTLVVLSRPEGGTVVRASFPRASQPTEDV